PAAPITRPLAFLLVEAEYGPVVYEGEPRSFVSNPLGTLLGGWMSTLLDSAMGCAVHSTLPAGKSYTTVDLAVSFVRTLSERVKHVRCEGTIVHAGSTIATAQGRLVDDAGTLYAHGSTTCLVMTPR